MNRSLLHRMSQTFYTATGYQLIYYYNLMKYSFKNTLKLAVLFHMINVHPVFSVEVYVSSDLCVTREFTRHTHTHTHTHTHIYREHRVYLYYIKQYSQFHVFLKNVFHRIMIADKLIFSGCVECLRHSL